MIKIIDHNLPQQKVSYALIVEVEWDIERDEIIGKAAFKYG